MSTFSPWPAFEKKVHKVQEWFGSRYIVNSHGLAWAKWISTIVVFHKRAQSLTVLPLSCSFLSGYEVVKLSLIKFILSWVDDAERVTRLTIWNLESIWNSSREQKEHKGIPLSERGFWHDWHGIGSLSSQSDRSVACAYLIFLACSCSHVVCFLRNYLLWPPLF